MSYENILSSLGLDQLVQLKSEKLSFDEILGMEIPFYEKMGFPPALIPFANSFGGLSLFGGYLSNIESNEVVFVDLLTDDQKIYEIALSAEQLIFGLVRRAMTDYYDEDTEYQIQKLCQVLGIPDSQKIGDMDDEDFKRLKVFSSGLPKYLKDETSGLSNGFEFSKQTNLVELFDNSMQENYYQRAWEYLNTSGWGLPEAKEKFKTLVDSVNNNFLNQMYLEWSKIDHPLEGY